MKYTVFYSWQSDLPNNTNRGFLEEALKDSFALITERDFEIEFALDRDTKGMPGAPNIANTIIEKISKCDVFIADISIIHQTQDGKIRKSPNPNVLLELGYAIAQLGTQRIILLFNDNFGKEDSIPFDIRQNRRINYSLAAEAPKASERKKIAANMAGAISAIIAEGTRTHRRLPEFEVNIHMIDEEDAGMVQPSIPQVAFDARRLASEARWEKQKIHEIDGSVDPSWNEKIEKYMSAIDEYISALEEHPEEIYMYLMKSKLTKLFLSVRNTGTLAAQDVRVSIKIPKQIAVFEEFPSIKKIVKPELPRVVVPAPAYSSIQALNAAFALAMPMFPEIGLSKIGLSGKRSHACYIKNGNEVYFWAERILHQHEVNEKEDGFYLLPRFGYEDHAIKLTAELFCSEFEAWKHAELSLPIEKSAHGA